MFERFDGPVASRNVSRVAALSWEAWLRRHLLTAVSTSQARFSTVSLSLPSHPIFSKPYWLVDMAHSSPTPPPIDFGPLADFLRIAIRDAGPAAELPSPSPPSQSPAIKDAALDSPDDPTTAIAIPCARKLATVKKISSIHGFTPSLNLVSVEGWTVIVSSSKSFVVGEMVLFLEPDTFLPAGGE